MLATSLVMALGITWDGSLYEGEPCGAFTDEGKRIINACLALPEDTDVFCRLNYETDETLNKLKQLLSDGQILALKEFQRDVVSQQRRTSYSVESDGYYLEATFDGSSEKLEAWRLKVTEIKRRYPYW